ncbi:MAG: hypothetical protein AAGE94_09695 [Acidobacteriota bacterium]
MSRRWWSATTLFGMLCGTGLVLGAAALGLVGLDPDRGVALAFGAFTKLSFLTAAAVHALVCARRIASLAWKLMAAGFGGYALGQACLTVYQVVLHIPLPFPSWADLFFVSGSLVLVVALWVFLVELERTGCPLDLRRRLPTDLLWILGLGGVLSAWIVLPVFEQGIDVGTWLSLVYPVTDLLLLVPAVLLYQVTAVFRGGFVRRVWTSLLIGMGLFLVGDLLFSRLTEQADPWLVWAVDMSFVSGYALVARACAMQSDLVRGRAVDLGPAA